ncbi:MAG TPA: WbqC family protein [Candidatus Elarobacter sp.]|nr:WbqC family protein [Candidatus Elarobacter sp.]
MKTVVVLQPQFFPWRGVFEQIRLADEFVHLDDAQFQKGGFTNRVQLKTANGPLWLTVPVLRGGKLPAIAEVEIDYKSDWREKHLRTFAMSYARAPFAARARSVMADVYAERPRTIAQLDIAALERCCGELGLHPTFTRASETPVAGAKTDRLVALLVPRGTTCYVTGRGALDYLNEPQLAAAGIEVRVMSYARAPYPQLHGTFDPHVSILDLLANLGPNAAAALNSPAIPWHEAAAAHTGMQAAAS